MSRDAAAAEDARILIAFAPTPVGLAHEVFVLDLASAPRTSSGWDGSAYVDTLDRALLADASRPHTLTATRRRSTWVSHEQCIEVSLRLGPSAASDEPVDDEARAAVIAALRLLMERRSSDPDASLPRSEAIATARRAVAAGWSEPGDLAVSEEEHRAVQQRWVVGLAARDGSRYRVEVGVVDGDPSTVHAVRTAPPEVVVSIGT